MQSTTTPTEAPVTDFDALIDERRQAFDATVAAAQDYLRRPSLANWRAFKTAEATHRDAEAALERACVTAA